MEFHQYLQFMLERHNISQIKLLHKLQLFHAKFEGLDTITLSRWCNNKTRPSNHKQLLIASYFEKDLNYFIQKINTPQIPQLFIRNYNAVFDTIESSYNKVGYNPTSKGLQTLSLLNVNTETHRKLFSDFYQHMDTYHRTFNNIDKNNQSFHTTVFTIKQGADIISHLGFNIDMNKIAQNLKQNLPTKAHTKSIFINVGFYPDRDYYEALVGHLVNHIMYKHLDFEECYIATRGKDFIELLQHMGGSILLTSAESQRVGNVYLLKFDLKQLLSHPFIFQQAQRTYLSHLELMHNLTINFPVHNTVPK